MLDKLEVPRLTEAHEVVLPCRNNRATPNRGEGVALGALGCSYPDRMATPCLFSGGVCILFVIL